MKNDKIKSTLICFLLVCTSVLYVSAQTKIIGVVTDKEGQPIKGASVSLANHPEIKKITDSQGAVTFDAEIGSFINITYAGKYATRIKLSESRFKVQLDNNSLSVGLGLTNSEFGKLTQAVSTISSDDLSQNSSPRIYESLFGLTAGANVSQMGGYMSNNDIIIRGAATFWNQAPLFVVDGFPRAIENISPSEIEKITILKDGAATAIWGARGANGVVVIDTKRGLYKSIKFSVDYKHGIAVPTKMAQMADGVNYAKAVNEALYNDGLPARYNDAEIDAFQNNTYPYLYPNTSWLKEGLRNNTNNNQLTLTFRGGGEKARYFSVIDYRNDFGLLNYTDYDGRFPTQLSQYDLNIRLNMDVDVSPTTTFRVNLLGILTENKRPGSIAANNVLDALYTIPSAAFPVFTESGIWGGDNVFKSNPIAQIASTGYNRNTKRMLQADMRLKQDLTIITPGLSAEFAVAYDNNAVFAEPYTKKYMYQVNIPTMDVTTGAITNVNTTNYGEESELKFYHWLDSQYMRSGFEGNIKYNQTFGVHGLNLAAIYRQEGYVPNGRNGSRYRQNILGTASYSYDEKIFVDGVLNYYGTSVLPKESRFKLYPALSAAWIALKDTKTFDYLKVRASWGQSGLDNFGYELDHQYWENGSGYYFKSGNSTYVGISEGGLPVKNLRCEVADKFNVGADALIFRKLSTNIDLFFEKRSNILVPGSSVISSVIGIGVPFLNMGVVNAKGAELTAKWEDKIGDFKYSVGGNVSFVRTEIVENNEGYKPYEYLSTKGNRLGQIYGLEAIGYFNDQEDIDNSPAQKFGPVRPGDIKYKDQNNDDQINDDDKKPIGFSNVSPELFYGLQLALEYKSFGINAHFQGVSNYSVMLNTKNIYWPLQNNTNISSWYLEDNIRWTEQTKETANLPRLSTLDNPNNFRSSTQWLADGSFFKLRNLKVYYNLSEKLIKKAKLEKVQVYASGNDLFSIDKIPYLNCEDISLKYPNLTSFYVGLNVNF